MWKSLSPLNWQHIIYVTMRQPPLVLMLALTCWHVQNVLPFHTSLIRRLGYQRNWLNVKSEWAGLAGYAREQAVHALPPLTQRHRYRYLIFKLTSDPSMLPAAALATELLVCPLEGKHAPVSPSLSSTVVTRRARPVRPARGPALNVTEDVTQSWLSGGGLAAKPRLRS